MSTQTAEPAEPDTIIGHLGDGELAVHVNVRDQDVPWIAGQLLTKLTTKIEEWQEEAYEWDTADFDAARDLLDEVDHTVSYLRSDRRLSITYSELEQIANNCLVGGAGMVANGLVDGEEPGQTDVTVLAARREFLREAEAGAFLHDALQALKATLPSAVGRAQDAPSDDDGREEVFEAAMRPVAEAVDEALKILPGDHPQNEWLQRIRRDARSCAGLDETMEA